MKIGLITILALIVLQAPLAAPPKRAALNFVSPSNGTTVNAGAQITLSVSTKYIVKVAFFVNDTLVCEDLTAPFSCTYQAPLAGLSLNIKAVGSQASGATITKSVAITVLAPVTPPSTSTSVEVYPGCDPVATTYNNQVVVDGFAGESLQRAIDTGLVLPGDHVILKGPQGALQMTMYSHPSWLNATAWTKFEGQAATFVKIDVRDMKRMHFTNVKVSNSTGNIFALARAEHIVLSDSVISGSDDSSAWGVAEWLAAPNGIYADNSRCTSFLRNKLSNLRSGINVFTRGTTVETVVSNSLVKNNELRNLSADFMRPIGSNITFEGNRAYDGYVSAADGDTNHDDFIQGFALNGVPYENVKIINNFFQETTSPDRKWKSDYQGICVFDGLYNNYLVQSNTVIGSAYHGISMYGGSNGLIENNTVVSSYPAFGRNYWIHTPPTKTGLAPVNVTVRNNFANQILTQTTGLTYSNNAVEAPLNVSSHMVTYDQVNFRFDLRLRPESIYFGKNIGDQNP